MNRRFRLIAICCVSALAGLTFLTLVLTVNTAVQATVIDSSVPVSITESGFDPAVVTVTAGTTVVWTNHTQETVHMVSGEPYRIYLPLMLRNAGDTRAIAASPPTAAAAVTWQQDDWVDEDIPPGKSYTHTFTMSGNYPYFLTRYPARTGLVVVQGTPPPDFAIAARPVTQMITRGHGVSYTVAVTAVNGFTQAVTLDVGGVPASATVSWATNPLTPTANTTLIITPSMSGPTGTFTLIITGTSDFIHTTQVELIVVADPKEHNIPCLVVVGQHQPPGQPLPPVLAGCVAGTSSSITWRYDYRGAFIGFDLTIEDNGVIIYEASIDIERAETGRITSYEGTVSGDDFPDFTEDIVNKYNPQGGLIGADVNKVYTTSGDEYTMEITQFCPMATGNMTGYKVQVYDQEITIGSCP
jgi:plastocyanin